MLILIKEIPGDTFTLEIQHSDTILSIKDKIHSLKCHPTNCQRLYLQGEILDSLRCVSDYRILDGCKMGLLICKILPKIIPPVLVDLETPFNHLYEDPFFQLLQNIAQQMPSRLNQILAMLERSHPKLHKQIYQYKEAFLNLQIPNKANKDEIEGSLGDQMLNESEDEHKESSSSLSEAESLMEQSMLNENDRQSINTLMDFGFSKHSCVQAYLLNNKNEELALNFLVETPREEKCRIS